LDRWNCWATKKEKSVNREVKQMFYENVYRNRRVFVTGHTGFKGAWLCEWLLLLGAQVTGFALEAPTKPSLFEQLKLGKRLRDIRGDVRDFRAVEAALIEAEPEIIFHLAAQPLVRLSYSNPVETFDTNVMGVVHVLDAVRRRATPCGVVVVTTDKCYENREWVYGYREDDPMGGFDPYSASKGCAELVVNAFRRSFFSDKRPVAIASARAGNVIGGGDWAADRILPDCIRSLARGEVIRVRNPGATRPWQHVLEPLSGYLLLGLRLFQNVHGDYAFRSLPENRRIEGGFNFGPKLAANKTVRELVEEVLKHYSGRWECETSEDAPHEAGVLNLAIDKAHHFLGWEPVWDFSRTVKETVQWYCNQLTGEANMLAYTRQQISDYITDKHNKRT
jgi:CDP-glucose 4,6-dehydratase